MIFTIKDLQTMADRTEARSKRRLKGPIGPAPFYIRVGKSKGKGVKSTMIYDGVIVQKKGRKPACSWIVLDFDVKTGDLVGIEVV